jgi:hypothetical protein
LLPNLGPHLTVAFALSQLAIAIVLVPLVPWLTRSLDRLWPQTPARELVKVGDATGTVRAGLLKALRAERDSLRPLAELALAGVRSAGITAEHCLNDAHATLEALLSGPVRLLPAEPEGEALGRVAFGCLQLERSLESALRMAERLTDRRMEALAGAMDVPSLAGEDEVVLRETQKTLFEGIEALEASLESRMPVDLEAASAREIHLNGLEARARSVLLTGAREPLSVESRIGVVELVDAYETAGNQIYRLAGALSETFASPDLVAVV